MLFNVITNSLFVLHWSAIFVILSHFARCNLFCYVIYVVSSKRCLSKLEEKSSLGCHVTLSTGELVWIRLFLSNDFATLLTGTICVVKKFSLVVEDGNEALVLIRNVVTCILRAITHALQTQDLFLFPHVLWVRNTNLWFAMSMFLVYFQIDRLIVFSL